MIKLSNGIIFTFMITTDFWEWQFFKKYDLIRYSFLKLFFFSRISDKILNETVRLSRTITLNPVKGRPEAIYDAQEYIVDGGGLDSPGIYRMKKYLLETKRKIVLSITENDLLQLRFLIFELKEILKKQKNIIGVEFNSSCPNVKNFRKVWSERNVIRACRMLKENLWVPVGLKIGYHQAWLPIAQKTQGLVEWLSFDAIPWEFIFSNKESPLERKFGIKGAVSGKIIFEKNKEMALKIKNNGIETAIVISSIGWGKNFNEKYKEVIDILKWAEAVSFDSIFRKHIFLPFLIIRRYQKEKK